MDEAVERQHVHAHNGRDEEQGEKRKPRRQRSAEPRKESARLHANLLPARITEPRITPTTPVSGLGGRSEEHTSELQSHVNLVCRLLLEKKKKKKIHVS